MSEDLRLNPDALLAAIQKDEQERGRLKVFFGMSPGVGKTYAMLEAARRELASGRDVVVGYLETHGRRETDALATGLPEVPRRKVEYRGVTLTELDLDALLARRPQLALVDEMAHTNAPGSRHPKRYQDIQEILDAGIDVFTTLNVQHVESRAEIVREVTGATIHETVPDSLLDRAEIELVDLPPGELLTRMEEGKVYVADRAAVAASHFFREGNLIALREMALRLAAEHVGQDVREYLQTRQIAGPWKTAPRLLVAISPSPLSESMARWTRRLAGNLQASWIAVYVDTGHPLSDSEQERLQKNLASARQLGAEVITTIDQDVVTALLRVARQHNITQIVMGKPSGWSWLDRLRGRALLTRLINESGNIDVVCVRAEEEGAGQRPPRFRRWRKISTRQYLSALLAVAGTTAAGLVLNEWAGYYCVSLLYLLEVVALGLLVGRGPNLLAAAASALLWDILFVPPVHSLRIAQLNDALMCGMLFLVALAMGQLTTRLRAQQEAERERESRATALYLLTRALAEGKDFAELLGIVIRQLGDVFRADVAILLPNPGRETELVPYPFGTLAMSEKEAGVAAWAYQNKQPAGRDTDTLPSAEAVYLPLAAPGGCVGVVGLKFKHGRKQSLQERNLVENFIRQIALVLDRQRLSDAEQTAKLVAVSERLGQTLLNSISRELRTPLAAISSAATALNQLPEGDPAGRGSLTAEILEAGGQLNRLVGNLLDMTRLESGHVKPNFETRDIAELFKSARQRVAQELEYYSVTTLIPPGLPLVKMDFVLMEQVLVNLLLNVATHAPAGTAVQLKATPEGKQIAISVADNGPGIAPDALPHIFEKFYRAPNARAGGSGLGLSIVRGFVEAHSGSVEARNRPAGGAEIILRLPLDRGE